MTQQAASSDLIAIENGANVTITGNGTIHALEDDCYCVDVQNGSMLTIERWHLYW